MREVKSLAQDGTACRQRAGEQGAGPPTSGSRLRNPPFARRLLGLGLALLRGSPAHVGSGEVPETKRALPLLNSPGRKCQGPGGRCSRISKGLQWEACSQGRRPAVLMSPLQTQGSHCCSPPHATAGMHQAPPSPRPPFKTHLGMPRRPSLT